MVIWSQPGKPNLRSIHDFITHDSRFYAKKGCAGYLREKTDILEQLPRAGKKVPELDEDQVRELSLYSYRIIYEIKEQGISCWPWCISGRI